MPTVTITLTTLLTNKRIPRAKITAYTGEEALTDIRGVATLTLPSGATQLTFSKEGYSTETWTGEITRDAAIGASLTPRWMYWVLGLVAVTGASVALITLAKLLWHR